MTQPQHNEARNVMGSYDMWAKMFPLVNFFMFVLSWFTVPVEVLLRRNFGQRWLTAANFWAGLIVLFWFASIQAMGSLFGGFMQQFNPYQPEAPVPESSGTFLDTLTTYSMTIIIVLYLLVGSYHFFKTWWYDRIDEPLHSFSDGQSRLEFLGALLMQVVNVVAVPVISVYRLFLPKSDQRDIQTPPLVNDVTSFTDTVVEPLVLFILGFVVPGTAGTWLFVSAFALLIFANWKESSKLNRHLDLQDNTIAATERLGLPKIKAGGSSNEPKGRKTEILRFVAKKIEAQPEVTTQLRDDFPDLMSMIDDMHKDKQ